MIVTEKERKRERERERERERQRDRRGEIKKSIIYSRRERYCGSNYIEWVVGWRRETAEMEG